MLCFGARKYHSELFEGFRPLAERMFVRAFAAVSLHLVSTIDICEDIPLWGTHGVGYKNGVCLKKEYAITRW